MFWFLLWVIRFQIFIVSFTISFGIEVLKKIKDKSITHNIFRIQDNESIMCGFYCIAFIEYMVAGKSLLDYTNYTTKRMTK